MTVTPTVYRAIDSVLSNRERADQVLMFCFEGDLSRARRLLVDSEDADSHLARGVVGYWNAQTASASTYESAKDLLSKAARLFDEAGDHDRALLTGIWIGLCYWRQGQSGEALFFLNRSAEANEPSIRFAALLNRSVVESEFKNWAVCLDTLNAAQKFFDSEPSMSRRGKFFQQRGICYKQAFEQTANKEYLDKALIEYEAAIDHFERAGNMRFEAAILNNIANLYRVAGQTKRAHLNADRAITLYERIGDRPRLAHAKDTKALILLDEGRLAEANRYADQSITLLRGHDLGWVTIPLVTRARILCRKGLCSAAQHDFAEAVAIAERSGDTARVIEIYLDQADTLAEHLSLHAMAEIFSRINQAAPSRPMAIASKLLGVASAPEARSFKDLESAHLKREYEMILRTLEEEKGSVTRSAKVLGITHGGLTHIIKTRHQSLLKHCRPIVPRRKASKVK